MCSSYLYLLPSGVSLQEQQVKINGEEDIVVGIMRRALSRSCQLPEERGRDFAKGIGARKPRSLVPNVNDKSTNLSIDDKNAFGDDVAMIPSCLAVLSLTLACYSATARSKSFVARGSRPRWSLGLQFYRLNEDKTSTPQRVVVYLLKLATRMLQWWCDRCLTLWRAW